MSLVTTKPPLPVRVVNAAGTALVTLGLARVRLEMDPLLRATTRQTGEGLRVSEEDAT